MRRLTEGHFALGGIALLAIWLFVALPLLYRSIPSTQHVGQTAEQHSTGHEAKSKKEETDEALAHYTLWLMIFTGILAFATIGLGVATFGLYLTGEKQIRINAENAALQARDTQASIKAAESAAQAAQKSADTA